MRFFPSLAALVVAVPAASAGPFAFPPSNEQPRETHGQASSPTPQPDMQREDGDSSGAAAPVPYVPPASEYRPEMVVVEDTWNPRMFASGLLLFAGTYGAGVFVAATDNNPGVKRLYVPVAGPWLALDSWRHCSAPGPACTMTDGDRIVLIADGIAQAVGAAAAIGGLLTPSSHTEIVRESARVRVTPTGNGVAVLGRF